MSTTSSIAATITLSQLERTSKNWDKLTKTILLYVSGAGNMFGGHGKGYCITLHGENSIYPTGQIDILGVFTESYHIERSMDGGNIGSISYFKGMDNVDMSYLPSRPPTFKVDVTGSCDTGRDTLCTILSAQMDWLIN